MVSLAFSALLVLGTLGLFTGIVHSILATSERSRADIFVMPFNSSGTDQQRRQRPCRRASGPSLYLNPDVVDVRRACKGGGAQWVNVPLPGQKQVQTFVQIWAIDTEPGALTLPIDYPEATRVALSEPGAVAIDETDMKRLGVKLGDTVSLNNHTVRVGAILHNYQGVTQPSAVMSKETYRQIGLGPADQSRTGPLMVKIRDPKRADQVAAALNAVANKGDITLTTAQLSQNDEAALLSEQIIGVLLVSSSSSSPSASAPASPSLQTLRGYHPLEHSRVRQPSRARHLHRLVAADRDGALVLGRRRGPRRDLRS